MYKYNIYGYIFESDIELSECEPADANLPAEIRIVRGDFTEEMKSLEEDGKKFFLEQGREGEPNTYQIKTENGYVKYLFNIGYFKNEGSDLILYQPKKSVYDIDFRQWLICYATVVSLIVKKEAIIHCAGLLTPDTNEGIIICGDSGAGKSTITDSLMKKGLLFISDDSVRAGIEDGKAKIYGSTLQKRLCVDVVEREDYDTNGLIRHFDGLRDKWFRDMKDEYYGGKPHDFTKMFFLTVSDGDEVEVKEVTGPEKIGRLTRAFYKADTYKAEGMSPELFSKLANIAKDIRIFIVSRPQNRMTVDEITEKIYSLIVQ